MPFRESESFQNLSGSYGFHKSGISDHDPPPISGNYLLGEIQILELAAHPAQPCLPIRDALIYQLRTG